MSVWAFFNFTYYSVVTSDFQDNITQFSDLTKNIAELTHFRDLVSNLDSAAGRTPRSTTQRQEEHCRVQLSGRYRTLRFRFSSRQDTAESDSAVGWTPRSTTQRQVGHCRVQLSGSYNRIGHRRFRFSGRQDTAESDSAVGRKLKSPSQQQAGHCRV